LQPKPLSVCNQGKQGKRIPFKLFELLPPVIYLLLCLREKIPYLFRGGKAVCLMPSYKRINIHTA